MSEIDFKQKTFDNGLTVIGEVNPAAKSAAVGFFVRTGARDEAAAINGVSHFLEHMLFKGTRTLSAAAVNQAFDRTGAEFNAFTSEENTVYYAAVLPEYLGRITELWSELMSPALRDEDFSIEKNVIKEEIAMYKDLPSYDVADRCRSLHFEDHPCGKSVLGSEQTITELTAEAMRNYFHRRYLPNNMVVACAGNFQWQPFLSTVREKCGNWPELPAGRQVTPAAGSGKKCHIEKPKLVRCHLCLMSGGVPAQDPRRFAAFLLAEIIGDEVGSRFFWELVDNALAEVATTHYEPMDGTGILTSYISCGSENLEKVQHVVRGVFDDLDRRGVTAPELEKARNKVLSAIVIKNELPMGRLLDLGMNWTYLGCYRTVAEDVAAVKAVTVDDVNSLIQELKPGRFTQMALLPTAGGSQ